MGGGLSVINDTEDEVLVVLSQLGPLHWERLLPGERKEIYCGKVWFTVTASVWDDDTSTEPTEWERVAPVIIALGGALVVAVVILIARKVVGPDVMKEFAAAAATTVGTGAMGMAYSQSDTASTRERVPVAPVSHRGVYANWKTVKISCHTVETERGGRRQRLALSGTYQHLPIDACGEDNPLQLD